ncbi:MAG: DUF721 domain-containing protein [Thermodesulfovibrionales bacterium]|nr:DUF721 domain-containing protein [Thermodesulfovibrionales bacterium]
MKSAASVLSSIFKNLGIEDRIKLYSIQSEWRNIFGEPLSLHTYPVDLTNKELTINVDSPAWLGQLKFFRQDMLKKLQPYGISNVRLKHGRVYTKNIQKVAKNDRASKPLNNQDAVWIDQTISNLEDPELRDAIKKAMEKSLR